MDEASYTSPRRLSNGGVGYSLAVIYASILLKLATVGGAMHPVK